MLRVCIAAIFLVQSVASFSQSPLLWSNKNFARRSNSKSTSVLHQSSSTTTTSSNDEKSTDDGPNVSIEYCTGCRWGLRSSWYQQELLTTFHDEMGSVTLIPSKPPSPGGTFIVKLNSDTIWDRKTDGGFPEAKQLKQRVRDKIAPSKDLGHSDNTNNEQKEGNEDCEECNDNVTKSADGSSALDEGANAEDDNSTLSKNIEIAYCTGCKWMLRSAWISQELLSTFQEELRSVTLTPCRRKEDGGKFVVSIDGNVLWDRKTEGRFPEAKELKQRVRDQVDPSKDLGHSDVENKSGSDSDDEIDTMDDDDAAEMRAFYGVL